MTFLCPPELGGFKLGEQVGVGGMGVVYSSVRIADGRRFAIKLPSLKAPHDQTARDAARAELRTMMRLSHPHIVPVEAWGEHEGQLWIAMPLLAARQASDPGSGGPRALLALVEQLLDALAYAHDRGVVHRDIKPANLLITDSPHGAHLWLTDFGIAETSPPHQLGTHRVASEQETIVGTPAYMSPEQIRGEPVGPESDLYAVGVLLYQWFAGRLPFTGRTGLEVVVHHLRKPAPPLVGTHAHPVPRGLCPIVARLLAKHPLDRFPSASALRAALARVDLSDLAAPVLTLDRTHTQPYGVALPNDLTPALVPALTTQLLPRPSHPTRPPYGAFEGPTVDLLGEGVSLAVQRPPARSDDTDGLAGVLRRAGARIVCTSGALIAEFTYAEASNAATLALTLARLSPPQGVLGLGLGGHRDAALDAATRADGEVLVAPGLNLPDGFYIERSLGRDRLRQAAPPPARTPDAHPVLAERLRGLAAQVLSGGAARLDLQGATGLGKSVLLDATAQALRHAGWCVLRTRGAPGAPIEPLCAAIRRAIGGPSQRDTHLTALLLEAWRPTLGPALRTRLAGLLTTTRTPEADAHTHFGADEAWQAQTFALMTALFDHLTATTPVLLVVDDLHAAPTATAALCAHLLNHLGHRRLLLLSAARARVEGTAPLALAPLSRAASLAFLRGRVDAPLPWPDAEATPGGGVPFYLDELARRWRLELSEGLKPDQRHGQTSLMRARLAALKPKQRDALQRAAVIGTTFWGPQLSAILEQTGGAPCDALADEGLIVRSPSARLNGQPAWRFTQDLLRLHALSTVPPHLAIEVHLGAARWMEAQTKHLTTAHLRRLGEHWAAALRPGRAAAWLQRAAQQLEAQGAISEAGRAYARALQLVEPKRGAPPTAAACPVDMPRLLLAGARLAYQSGRPDETERLLSRLFEHPELDARVLLAAAAHRLRSEVLHARGETEAAVTALSEGLRWLGDAGDPIMRAQLMSRRGWLSGYVLGRNTEGRDDIEGALALVAELDAPGVETRIYAALGAIELRAGDWDRQLWCNHRSLALAQDAEDALSEARAHINLGVCFTNRGEFAAASAHTATAEAVAGRVGAQPLRLIALNNLGMIALDQGRLDDAEAHLDAATSLSEALGARHILPEVFSLKSRVALRRSAPTEALRWAKRAHHEASTQQSPVDQMMALRAESMARFALGEHAAASAALNTALNMEGATDQYEHTLTALVSALQAGHPTAALDQTLKRLGADPTAEHRRWRALNAASPLGKG